MTVRQTLPRRPLFAAALPLLALTLALLLAFAPTAPRSHADAFVKADAAGSIRGVVANGSQGKAPVAGQQVTLRAITLNRPHDAGTATTDAQGHFAFSGLDTTGETTYEVYTRYQGGFFITAPVTYGGSAAAAQSMTLTIYDTTTDMTALRAANVTVLISPVNKAKGLIPIGMFYTFDNQGTRAIAGSLTPPAGGGMPQGVLRFALPASATNLTLGAGFADAQTAQVSTGFAVTATIPPGLASFAFAFDLPYTGTAATLPLSAQYPTAQVTVLAPPAYHVQAPGFAPGAPISANGQQYQQFQSGPLATGAAPRISLAALPEAGVDPDLRFSQLLPIAAVLALLLALLLALFIARGNLSALRKVVGWSRARQRGSRRASAHAVEAHSRALKRQQLLEALLDLDEQHTQGAIPDAAYARQRDIVRAELRALLAAQAPAPQPALPARRGENQGTAGFATDPTERDGDAAPGAHDTGAAGVAGSVAVVAHAAKKGAADESAAAPGPRPASSDGGSADSGAAGERLAAPTKRPAGAAAPRAARARRSRTAAGGGR
jgi:hypothetical protein